MLFKDSPTLKKYAQLSGEINFTSIRQTLRYVEAVHIMPVLGKELYDSLNDAFTEATNENSLSDEQKDLLDQCRCVIGPYVCFYYAPKADIQLGDGGSVKNKEAGYQYQLTNYREANLKEAETSTELLLQFLEENKEDYNEWVESPAFDDYKSLFIKTGDEFGKLFSSASPYRNYWAMRSKMVDVEEHSIRMTIGDALFDALKTKDQSDETLTEKEKELLFKLKKAIANSTVAVSIPLLNVQIDANGISVLSLRPGSSRDEDRMRTAANDKALDALIQKCNETAATWLSDAITFLNNNASDFPQYTPPKPKHHEHHEHRHTNTRNGYPEGEQESGAYAMI